MKRGKSGCVTVNKGLDILEAFLQQPGEIGISDLSKLSRLNISTAYRIASTLVGRGYLCQKREKGKYSLGMRFLAFGSMLKKGIKVRNVALPFLEKLHEEAGEPVNLALLDSDSAVYIEHIDSTQTQTLLRTFTSEGNRVPLHCTGIGKVFLACMKDEEVRFLTRTLPRYTDNTITTFGKLKKELLIVRREGVAVDDEEREIGVKCVASPIKDWNGHVVAAISVSGPSARLCGVFDRHLGISPHKYAMARNSLTNPAQA